MKIQIEIKRLEDTVAILENQLNDSYDIKKN